MPSSPRPLCAGLLLGVLTLVPAGATAQPAQPARPTESAAAIAGRARAAYEGGDFDEAIALYRRAYEKKPDPTLLFNLGRCHEALGTASDLDAAVAAYTRYLDGTKDAPDRAAVERRIESLRAQIDVLRRPKQTTTSAPTSTAPTSSTPPVEDGSAPVSPWPWVITGIGVAGIGAGIGLGVAATDAHDAAAESVSATDALELADRANGLGIGATVAFVAGGVLAAAGVAWGIVDVATRGPATVTLSVSPGNVALVGRF